MSQELDPPNNSTVLPRQQRRQRSPQIMGIANGAVCPTRIWRCRQIDRPGPWPVRLVADIFNSPITGLQQQNHFDSARSDLLGSRSIINMIKRSRSRAR